MQIYSLKYTIKDDKSYILNNWFFCGEQKNIVTNVKIKFKNGWKI